MDDNELSLCIKSPANSLYSTLDQERGKDKIRDLVYERNSQVQNCIPALAVCLSSSQGHVKNK